MKENKQLAEQGKGKDNVIVVRYEGSKNILKMIADSKYIEAFVHTQLGIEKILWNRIVALFKGENAMMVQRTIDENRRKYKTGTYELIKWAYFLNAINDSEFNNLLTFNKERNILMHTHGEWWNKSHEIGLKKGIKFLEENNL